jgi:hypothetical protein
MIRSLELQQIRAKSVVSETVAEMFGAEAAQRVKYSHKIRNIFLLTLFATYGIYGYDRRLLVADTNSVQRLEEPSLSRVVFTINQM